MIKIFGFMGIVLGAMVLLRPEITQQLFSSVDTPTPINASSIDLDKQRGGTPETYKKLEGKTAVTQYADGYSEDDFSGLDLEGDFPVTEDEQPQAEGLWEIFLDLQLETKYDPDLEDLIFEPKFTKKILSYEGKEIEMKGYIIPSDIVANATGGETDNGMFMLSAFPISSCFFCGGSGPESVMEVYPAKAIPYSTKAVTIKGRLELNKTDFLRMFYILKDAEIVYK